METVRGSLLSPSMRHLLSENHKYQKLCREENDRKGPPKGRSRKGRKGGENLEHRCKYPLRRKKPVSAGHHEQSMMGERL